MGVILLKDCSAQCSFSDHRSKSWLLTLAFLNGILNLALKFSGLYILPTCGYAINTNIVKLHLNHLKICHNCKESSK